MPGRVSALSPWGWRPTLDQQGNCAWMCDCLFMILETLPGITFQGSWLSTVKSYHPVDTMKSPWCPQKAAGHSEISGMDRKASYNSAPSFGIPKRNLLQPQILQFSQRAKSKIFFSKGIIGWIFFFFKANFQERKAEERECVYPCWEHIGPVSPPCRAEVIYQLVEMSSSVQSHSLAYFRSWSVRHSYLWLKLLGLYVGLVEGSLVYQEIVRITPSSHCFKLCLLAAFGKARLYSCGACGMKTELPETMLLT